MTEASAARSRRQLGTFLGVFTPSVLTILGVVLFLRTGWVVGNVGLVPTLLIVLLSHSITFATALSVSAIATNMRVGTGGAYFMISRSLGLEIGGAIGLPLFLAQTFSVTLYAFGLAEALQLFWPQLPLRPVAALTVLVVAAIAGRSTQWALRLQIPILVLIGLALASLFLGVARTPTESLPLWSGAERGESFWVVFAVFFPAVTGLMAGVSLSGDLKDPERSLPRGTLAAVTVGLVAYLTVPVALAAAASAEQLLTNNLIWFDLAAVGWLVFPGLLGAIVSSAVGSILSAPRTLEALVEDRLLPRLPGRFARTAAGRNMPHLISTGVALAAVALGDLNAVAPVLTMFFLTTYGMVNLVAGLEQLSGSPSYRPALRVPSLVSLAGAVGCIWVMWLIHPLAAVTAVVVELAVYWSLRHRSLSAAWGDLRYGVLMSLTRAFLLKLRQLPVDPRNWRPHILLFAGDVEKRAALVRFATWLNQERGILTVSRLLIGDLETLAGRRQEELRQLDDSLREHGILAFGEVEVTEDFESGVVSVCQANGIAGLSSNTIMFGWTDKPDRLASLLRIAHRAALLDKSTLLCHIAPRRWTSKLQRIDVWWGGLQSNGDMMLLFAYLISVNREWSDAEICVKSICTSAMTYEQTRSNIDGLLQRSRIQAQAMVLPRPEERSVQELIHDESKDADLVLMGLQAGPLGGEEEYAERLQALVGDLPTVILVRAAGPFAGHLLESSVDAE